MMCWLSNIVHREQENGNNALVWFTKKNEASNKAAVGGAVNGHQFGRAGSWAALML
jgi:hypothetical protein